MLRTDPIMLYSVLLVLLCAPVALAYDEEWNSLAQHPVPEWFENAKFGIYAHWGPYSVPAFGSEWYPRNMYKEEQRVFRHHVEKYGGPAAFGYKDFIPLFKAEKFDAEAWAELYVRVKPGQGK